MKGWGKKPCCSDFGRAQQSGTDNEGYGRLIMTYPDDPDAYIGSGGLPTINYCPWCGKKVSELEPHT
jgi:hypothetical protein